MRFDTPQLNQCPKCGKFVKNIGFLENGLHDIKEVWGTCKTHGKVSLFNNSWSFEQLHGSEECCHQANKA